MSLVFSQVAECDCVRLYSCVKRPFLGAWHSHGEASILPSFPSRPFNCLSHNFCYLFDEAFFPAYFPGISWFFTWLKFFTCKQILPAEEVYCALVILKTRTCYMVHVYINLHTISDGRQYPVSAEMYLIKILSWCCSENGISCQPSVSPKSCKATVEW